MSSSTLALHTIRIRRAVPPDAAAAGRICYEAFAEINRTHGFPPDIPTPEAAMGLLEMFFSNPSFFCLVAESEGRIVGSNCLDERGTIAGLGPITVDPIAQNSSIGRQLMRAMLERSRERGFPGVRLLQSTFHNRSLSLYAKLGFDAREPMSVMQGAPIKRVIDGYAVRPAEQSDLDACNALCELVHGHHRAGELRDAIAHETATVVEHHGRISGYASVLGFFGHAVAESDADLQAMIAAADSFAGPGLIVPTRNSRLFRWCLAHGLRVMQPLTLMTSGLYNEPHGAYLPSILY
jgi:GNAT superfamily N-acetyltransferase